MSGLSSGSRSRLARPAPAAELYHSTLLQLQRRDVERHTDFWFGLAAKHGALTPETVLEPYNGALTGGRLAARVVWAVRVAQPLAPDHNPAATWLVRAGATDCEPLLPLLTGALHRPLAGLGSGEQIAWPQGELAEKNQQPRRRGPRPAPRQVLADLTTPPHSFWARQSARPNRGPARIRDRLQGRAARGLVARVEPAGSTPADSGFWVLKNAHDSCSARPARGGKWIFARGPCLTS